MQESGPSFNPLTGQVNSTAPGQSYTTKEYWETRYSGGNTSGYGSYGEQLQRKLSFIEKLEGIKTVTEIGCGDFNFGKHVLFSLKLPMTAYTGYDVSPFIVARNTKLYPNSTFKEITEFPKETGDLLMCVDVLLHLLEDKEYQDFVDNLAKLWTTGTAKYLVVTAYDRVENLGGHVRIRKFDTIPFGTPITKEVVEEDGEHFIYIFKK